MTSAATDLHTAGHLRELHTVMSGLGITAPAPLDADLDEI